MGKPLVSILIPTYNQSSFVGAAIRSALSQDYEHLEVIVSDDASTDDTPRVAGEFSDGRLRYHRLPTNSGRVANYRRGLYELAKGDWVLNLDGDDYLVDPSFVRAAVAAADDSAVLVFADRYEGSIKSGAVERSPRPAESARPEFMDGTAYVLSLPRNRIRIHHLAAIYRRREAISVDFYRADIVSSDYESIYRLLLGRKLVHLPAKVAVWRRHAGNASRQHSSAVAIRNLQLFQNVRDYAIGKLGTPRTRDFDRWLEGNISNRLYGSALSYWKRGDFSGWREIAMYVHQRYPAAHAKTFRSPKRVIRALLAIASGLVLRIVK